MSMRKVVVAWATRHPHAIYLKPLFAVVIEFLHLPYSERYGRVAIHCSSKYIRKPPLAAGNIRPLVVGTY